MVEWTQFMDMHSGGGAKVWRRPDGSFFDGGRFTDANEGTPIEYIYIEAPEEEAVLIFYNRFGHSPSRVTCTCCGDDYSLSTEPTLARLTAYHRNCDNLETPRGPDGRYVRPDDPWFDEHYYLEPGEEAEAISRGYRVKMSIAREVGQRYPDSDFGKYITLDEYIAQPNVLVIRATDIKPEERTGDVPEQGYVWVG